MKLVPTNPMNKVLSAILAFEALCCGLTIPGMIQLTSIAVPVAFTWGLASAALCLVAAGLLRRPIGWVLAWAAQLACLALGFGVDMMFPVAGMFLLLFAITFVLGRRLELARTSG